MRPPTRRQDDATGEVKSSMHSSSPSQ
jgi:hypothetical protein